MPPITNDTEYLAANDPGQILLALGDQLSERKRMLFCVACGRAVRHLLKDQRSLHRLEALQAHADRLIGTKAMRAIDAGAEEAARMQGDPAHDVLDPSAVIFRSIGRTYWTDAAWVAAQSTVEAYVQSEIPEDLKARLETDEAGSEDDFWKYRKVIAADVASDLANVLRDIIGNPFHRIRFQKKWVSQHVRELAQTIYDNDESRDLLPILADALEEAGCTGEAILKHCREPGQHFRGCWVVDRILRKR